MWTRIWHRGTRSVSKWYRNKNIIEYNIIMRSIPCPLPTGLFFLGGFEGRPDDGSLLTAQVHADAISLLVLVHLPLLPFLLFFWLQIGLASGVPHAWGFSVDLPPFYARISYVSADPIESPDNDAVATCKRMAGVSLFFIINVKYADRQCIKLVHNSQ